MSASKLFLVSLVVFISAFGIFVSGTPASSGEEVVASEIERAEGVMVSAYEAVLEAERAGANVSDLLAQLNDGAGSLPQARVLYRAGDFDGAVRLANLCGEVGEYVRKDAYRLRDLAVKEADERFRWTLIGSIVGVGVIVCVAFVGWRAFKRRYYRRILGMRPGVVSGGS